MRSNSKYLAQIENTKGPIDDKEKIKSWIKIEIQL